MIGKIIVVMFLFVTVIFFLGFVYQNLPQEPVQMKTSETTPEPTSIINYGTTPVFGENMRFNHNNISYFIETKCTKIRKDSMIKAFNIFEEKIKIISFYEVKKNADIDIKCSDGFVPLGHNLFAGGEGGPSNTSYFKVIEKGDILLYKDSKCDSPIIELHELGHVFGFDHSVNSNNIMYNISNCKQRIGQDMIELIKELYLIEALPDASMVNIAAIKKGRYLDFNITVLNEGLLEIDFINLTIVTNGKKIQTMDLGNIDIGYGRTLEVKNTKLPSRNIEEINFIIDEENNVRELNENNNFIQMIVESQ